MKALLQRSTATGFAIDPNAVEVQTGLGPRGFHAALSDMIRGARSELSLASLYLGTGETERALVDDVRFALRRSEDLRVRIVLDDSRARRSTPDGTSVDVLSPLLRDHPRRVELFLHRMPQLTGPLALLPSPVDELVAVFHLKALVADDTALLSGANLSDEYFRCRQARSLRVRDSDLCATLHALVRTTADHSRSVACGPHGSLTLSPSQRSATALAAALRELGPGLGDPGDTRLTLLFQHASLGLQQERAVLRDLFSRRDGHLDVATAYPSFPSDYVDALSRRLRDCSRRTSVVSPSPRSHSFTTGRGLKGFVPQAYAHRERAIARRLCAAAGARDLRLRHYEREGWVFHAKGVWHTGEDETATVVGSSSFGQRSVTRDLDLSALLVTRDPRLRADLADEVDGLLAHTHPAKLAGEPPLTVRLLYPFGSRFL